MEKTIRNSSLSVTVKRLGAELSSIKTPSGKDYLWEADPAIWGRHAPVLFPIVGKLADDTYRYNGKSYSLNQHGFARNMEFQFISESENSLSCRLTQTPETKQAYPFDFVLTINYTLSGNVLETEYCVENPNEAVMPFSIGAHPAFALNWGENDRIEDYYLEFEKPETVKTHHLDQNHLLSDETETVLLNEKIIQLHENMFNRDALILLDLTSDKVSLCSNNHKQRITVEFSDFPYLGVWAKPKARYVCIEPWHGYVDPAGTDGRIINKPGIIKLDPGRMFSCVHRIEISDQ